MGISTPCSSTASIFHCRRKYGATYKCSAGQGLWAAACCGLSICLSAVGPEAWILCVWGGVVGCPAARRPDGECVGSNAPGKATFYGLRFSVAKSCRRWLNCGHRSFWCLTNSWWKLSFNFFCIRCMRAVWKVGWQWSCARSRATNPLVSLRK